MIDFSNFKVRCSALNMAMSNSQSNPVLTDKQAARLAELRQKIDDNGILPPGQAAELTELEIKEENGKKIVLSDTCITYLMEEFAYRVFKKLSVTKEMDVDFMQKGREVEEESIALLSKVDETTYSKNSERVENEFLSGEPDIYTGPSIMAAKSIIDTKSVWDYPGFLKKIHSKIDPAWDIQVKGYMDITGAEGGEIAHVLVDMPPTIINDYKRRLFYKMGVTTDESPEYVAAARKLEHSMTFGEIPAELRVNKVKVEPFSQERRQQVYDRVKVCREWLFNFTEQYLSKLS